MTPNYKYRSARLARIHRLEKIKERLSKTIISSINGRLNRLEDALANLLDVIIDDANQELRND